MTNEGERLHHHRFPDSGGPPNFVSSGNVESALLNNIVYREGFSKFKQKSQTLKLNFPLTGRVQSLLLPRKADQLILTSWLNPSPVVVAWV